MRRVAVKYLGLFYDTWRNDIMNGKRFRLWVILCALVGTATHFVLADGKFVFSDRSDSDYVRVRKISATPFKFKFARCHAEGGCVDFGKKQGYTPEDVRIPIFKLMEKRETGHLSSAESRDLETLQDIILGIESPRLHYPKSGYTHEFKGSAEQFVRVVDERLGQK
jgi:hypothetical protein